MDQLWRSDITWDLCGVKTLSISGISVWPDYEKYFLRFQRILERCNKVYFLSWTVIYILWGYLEKAIVTLLLFSFCYQRNSFRFERDETTECRGTVPMWISGPFIGETKAVVKGGTFPRVEDGNISCFCHLSTDSVSIWKPVFT